MPVLPEVGSRMMVSGLMRPARSAASIMDRPIRSLTLWAGLENPSFATTRPPAPARGRPRGRRAAVRPVLAPQLRADQPHRPGGEPANLHQRRVADQRGDVAGDLHGGRSPWVSSRDGGRTRPPDRPPRAG